jgi:hypothetical protein
VSVFFATAGKALQKMKITDGLQINLNVYKIYLFWNVQTGHHNSYLLKLTQSLFTSGLNNQVIKLEITWLQGFILVF